MERPKEVGVGLGGAMLFFFFIMSIPPAWESWEKGRLKEDIEKAVKGDTDTYEALGAVAQIIPKSDFPDELIKVKEGKNYAFILETWKYEHDSRVAFWNANAVILTQTRNEKGPSLCGYKIDLLWGKVINATYSDCQATITKIKPNVFLIIEPHDRPGLSVATLEPKEEER